MSCGITPDMNGTQNMADDPRALLDWYLESGVDMAMGEEPVDQFALSAVRKPQAPQPAAQASQSHAKPVPGGPITMPKAPAKAGSLAPGTPKPGGDAVQIEANAEDAQKAAADAKTLSDLEEILRNFDGCALKVRATQLVFADGNPEADIMLIGEAPGREEDLQGKPFVGRSGLLLDKMLGAIGLDRTKVYIANTVPWRPPGNRTPTPAEIATCLPFLHRQIELVDPKFIMTLGAPAAQTMFETKSSISRMRGQWQTLTIAGKEIKALATLHPAFLLRQPAQKQLAWRDMLMLKQALEN